MAERDNDEIAAALHGLSGGEPPLPASAPPAKAPGAKRAAAPAARPVKPSAPVELPGTVTPAVVKTVTPARSSKSGRPVLPGQFTPPPIEVQELTTADEMPAQSSSPPPPRTRSSRAPTGFRRTMIPILLTLGAMMIILALGPIMFDPDAPLSNLPAWSRLMLCLGAVLLLALAVINMLSVRSAERA